MTNGKTKTPMKCCFEILDKYVLTLENLGTYNKYSQQFNEPIHKLTTPFGTPYPKFLQKEIALARDYFLQAQPKKISKGRYKGYLSEKMERKEFQHVLKFYKQCGYTCQEVMEIFSCSKNLVYQLGWKDFDKHASVKQKIKISL